MENNRTLKEQQKEWNKNMRKDDALAKSYIYEENDFLVYESNKQRVNISINSALWNDFDNVTDNKSRFVEKLIVEFMQKYRGKEIVLKKSEF